MAFQDGDLCLVDNAATHTILKEKKYFEYLILTKDNITIISGPTNMIKGFGKANILLPNNTKLGIKNALYSPESWKKLLGFKDIHANGYHIEIINEDRKEYLYTISRISVQKLVLEKLFAFFLEFIIWSWNLLKQMLWYTSSVPIQKHLCFGMIDLDTRNQ